MAPATTAETSTPTDATAAVTRPLIANPLFVEDRTRLVDASCAAKSCRSQEFAGRPLRKNSSMDSERTLRIGENEALFRAVNEKARDLSDQLAIAVGLLRVICECGHLDCIERFELPLADYEAIRADPTLFAVV